MNPEPGENILRKIDQYDSQLDEYGDSAPSRQRRSKKSCSSIRLFRGRWYGPSKRTRASHGVDWPMLFPPIMTVWP